MPVGLDVDAALMTGGVSLCHHNKVINIIANLCVYVCRESHGIATLHNFNLLLDL